MIIASLKPINLLLRNTPPNLVTKYCALPHFCIFILSCHNQPSLSLGCNGRWRQRTGSFQLINTDFTLRMKMFSRHNIHNVEYRIKFNFTMRPLGFLPCNEGCSDQQPAGHYWTGGWGWGCELVNLNTSQALKLQLLTK